MTRIDPRRLTWSAYAGMAVFGFAMAVTGAVLPRLEIGLDQAGNLFFVLALAMLAGMLLLGPVIDRFGKKAPLAAGAVLVSAALVIMARAGSFRMLMAGVALAGFGGSALNGATNTLVADLHDDPARKGSALNLLGVFFGFGALLIPFVIGALIERLGLAMVLYIPAAVALAVGAVFAVLRFPAPRHVEGVPFSKAIGMLRDPLVLLFAATLFFQSGNEFVFGGYFSTFLTRESGLTLQAASYVLAGFWASIMLTRVAASRLLLNVPATAVVLASAAGTIAGLAVVALSPSPWAAAAGILLTGVAGSSIYPTVLGIAGTEFAEWSGTVFGILFSVALVGGMIVPWAVGQIAERNGMRIGLALPATGAAMVFMLQAGVARRLRRAR